MGFARKIGRKIDKAILQPVKNTVQAIVEDPKKLLAVGISVAFPGAGALLGAQLGIANATLAQVVGQTLINTAVNGGDVKAAVISAALPIAGKEASNLIGETLSKSGITGAVNKVVTDAATRGLTAAALGKDPLAAMTLGGVTAGVTAIAESIPDFSELSASARSAIQNAIATKLVGGDVGQSLVDSAIDFAKKEVITYQKRGIALGDLKKSGLDFGDDYSSLSEEQKAVVDSIASSKNPPAAITQYKDTLYTDESEAREMARAILGREPSDFEVMEFIGIPESNTKSLLEAIRYDESTFDSGELADAYKAKYGVEPTADWLASDEAMDMLGRSEAQGQNLLNQYYTKDKNWVTEDEAQQFWKDMGNTGPVPQEFMDSMLMTTENGAKAMSEAHRINAEDIAATTFDGSQYATPQEAAAAAKAAGFNAFTHKDKNLTYFTQPSPVEEANIRADVEEKKTFNEAFAAARKELGAGKTFTWNGKQYTTNTLPKDTFDASRSSTITTAATLALANGKDKFIGPDGKTYKLDDKVKSVLANSVNESPAETQRLLRQAIKPATDETAAETQRLMESGTRGTMDTVGAMAAQALGTTQRGFGQFLSNAGKTYAAITGDLDFDNALIKIGKEVESYAKGSDIYGLDVQKNRLSQAMARANETDNWMEKTKILGSAISKNSIGFFDVAGSEVVEELPETILQIGAALMTGGTTLAAKGAVAAIGAAGSVMETFGGTVEETYKQAKKAGDDDQTAMAKAYGNGVLSTAIEVGTNFVADKAMLAPFLNKFAGTLAGTATGFVSSTAIGAATNLVAGLSQSYATQYLVNPETASLSKAATDGIFEAFIGTTAQGAMGLPGYAIQGSTIIGKDYFGQDVTMDDVAAGAILDSSTVDPNATIATSDDGDPITLGGAMLQTSNNQLDLSTLKTYVPQVFDNDSLVVGQDELGNDVTYGELMGQTTDSKNFDAVYKDLLDITPEQRTEAKLAQQNVATKKDIQDAIASIQIPTGLTKTDVSSAISEYMKVNPNVTAADVAGAISEYMTANPGLTKKDLDNAVTAATKDFATTQDIESAIAGIEFPAGLSKEDVTFAIADYMAANPGLSLSDVSSKITEATSGLATSEGVAATIGDALKGYATTQDIKDAIAGIKFPEGISKEDVAAEIKAAMEANPGLSATDVTKSITDYMTANPGLTAADLDTAISSATKDLATTAQLTNLQNSLADEIQAAKDIGLEGDAAIQAGLDSLAEKVGTNQADLLTQLGTTAADLKTQFATDIAASQEATAQEIANTKTALETAIADAKASGLEGDAALKAAIDAVAADQQTSSADLLTKLGTTEADLKSEFAAGLAGVSAEVADARKALEDAIQAAQDIGLEGDAALQAGIDSVAANLGTTKEALLTQLGTTEETLRTEFATGISNLETQMQEQYDALTTEQKALADALTAQGTTLADAIAAAQESTATQISELEAATNAQYEALTAEQKALADALTEQGATLSDAIASAQEQTAGQITDVETRLTDAIAAAEAMGLSRDQAITAAVESVAADLGTTKTDLLTQLGTTEQALRTEFTTGLAGVSAEVKAAYDSLTAEQKALADQLAQQGVDLTTAIQTAQEQTQTQIGDLTADVQAKFDALTAEQKALANQLTQQGVDLNTAIETAQQQTQQQIADLGVEVDARINELMQQGQTYQQATQQAFAEVNAKNQEMAGLIGTQGRAASQQDIDALTEMLGGQRSMDLAYDVTGDKQITQADIDFLTQVVGGTKTDWTAPQQSPWAATGLYGQIQANELQRQKDLADATAAAEAQRVADQQAAAERDRQANIRTTATRAQTSTQGIMQQLEAMQRAGMAPQPVQLVESSAGFDLSSPLNTGFFSGFQSKKPQQNQQPTTKIAAGGYIDDLLAGDMTADDLLNLLR
jgi:hypothetical protein